MKLCYVYNNGTQDHVTDTLKKKAVWGQWLYKLCIGLPLTSLTFESPRHCGLFCFHTWLFRKYKFTTRECTISSLRVCILTFYPRPLACAAPFKLNKHLLNAVTKPIMCFVGRLKVTMCFGTTFSEDLFVWEAVCGACARCHYHRLCARLHLPQECITDMMTKGKKNCRVAT